MLQATARRLEGIFRRREACRSSRSWCATRSTDSSPPSNCAAVVAENHRILLEPSGRNTAPALTLAALLAHDDGDDPLLLVMPADHVVRDLPAFQGPSTPAWRRRRPAPWSPSGSFRINPNGLWATFGSMASGPDGSRSIAAFVEKPDLETAEAYVASGEYLWNSGLFMMRASVWLKGDRCLQSGDGGGLSSRLRGRSAGCGLRPG